MTTTDAEAPTGSPPPTELPADVAALIDAVQYEIAGEFPVEQGYIWTSCASVENGNPLFWDEATAEADHRRPHRPADHAVGLVPPAPLGARSRPSRPSPCRCTST